jgi:3-hydroxyisobutyrate dehydrogenase-like beta-hydroxyacid dehydrogenase
MSHPLSPVGFIGLGLLGQAMALRLVQQGTPLVVWNREPERCAALTDAGAVLASSPQDVARQCRVVCLCVIDGKAVQDVVFGSQGLVQAQREPRTVIDFSTVDPSETRAIAVRAAEAALRWIDAPVSGGPAAALTGSLTLMAGGAAADIASAEQLLRTLASRFTHVGAVGSGQEMKVINQALVGATAVMLAEVLTLARKLGLPLELVPSCLEGGLADSVGLQRIWPRMAGEQYEPPTGRASQMFKDLRNVDALRAAGGLELPLLQTAVAQYRAFVEQRGAGDAETFSIPRLYQS